MFPVQSTQWLLFSGVTAAAVFLLVATIEIFARPGFDLTRHAVSMLSLGERGWLMSATFILSGLLTVAFSVGMWRATGTWIAPLLFGLYGAGFVIAGVFPAPAGMGFPPGTPDDLMPVMDAGAILHSVGFMLAFAALIVGSFVLAAHFGSAGDTLTAILCAAAGLAIPILIGLGMGNIMPVGVAAYLAGMLGWLIVTVAAIRLSGAGP